MNMFLEQNRFRMNIHANQGKNRRNQICMINNVTVNFHTTIKCDAEFEFQGSSYAVLEDYNDQMLTDGVLCKVVETTDSPGLDTTHIFTVAQAHNLVLELLKSIA